MAENTNPEVEFVRRLLNNATKIEAVCKKCGAVIVGSVQDGLPEQESKHAAECKFKPQRDQKIIQFEAKGRRGLS